MWREGAILIDRKVYKYQVEFYKRRSRHGIEGGRISRLRVTCEDMVKAEYEWEWVKKPEDEATEFAVAILKHEHN